MVHDSIALLLVGLVAASAATALLSFLIAYPRATRRARDAARAALPPPSRTPRIEPEPAAVPAQPRPAEPEARPRVVEIPAPPEPAAAPEPVAPVPAPPPKPDWAGGLRKTRVGFIGRLESLLSGRKELDADTLDEVEAVLFGADIGVRTADELMEAARAAGAPEAVRPALEARAIEMLSGLPDPHVEMKARPHVLLVVGVNGSGKTTTIGKLAARWTAEGKRVVVAAGDTYRAAAIEQLGVWAERAGAEIIKGEPGGDPAAVAFDAIKASVSRDADVCIIDTAGRLQTDAGLMDELAKMNRVIQKDLPDAPHEVLLVLDGNTGQNAIRQAQEFSRVVPVTGIALTKLDGTAKGGVVLGVAQEVGLPVRYVGIGEGVSDLAEFDAEPFVRALFTPPDA